ncbi:MAG TPA: hypothetical protein PLL36_01825 [Candidatus Hydrogenedentes bacterium]|jgi:hypothetical protein|nr:MAG: hypothetical protein BWX80_01398 [Candidatus Hydrogenedentes bacterium ADurb.Bin101]HOC67264.1 hypothetical protein [Candidatus Hydrogenedentota bacterium]HQM99778.1 hypothetical protein [Candidatus Hydrogenedentota bacterium]
MRTHKFSAKVKNGTIEIPEQYRAQISELVNVILINTPSEPAPDLISRLLETPLQTATFKPMARDETHGRFH